MTPLGFVVVCLAAARITRLITEDDITEPLREWASDRPAWFYQLVTCPWCIGFHISVMLVLAYWMWEEPATWISLPFAISYVVGRLASLD